MRLNIFKLVGEFDYTPDELKFKEILVNKDCDGLKKLKRENIDDDLTDTEEFILSEYIAENQNDLTWMVNCIHLNI